MTIILISLVTQRFLKSPFAKGEMSEANRGIFLFSFVLLSDPIAFYFLVTQS